MKSFFSNKKAMEMSIGFVMKAGLTIILILILVLYIKPSFKEPFDEGLFVLQQKSTSAQCDTTGVYCDYIIAAIKNCDSIPSGEEECSEKEKEVWSEYKQLSKDCQYSSDCSDEEKDAWNEFYSGNALFFKEQLDLDVDNVHASYAAINSDELSKILVDSSIISSQRSIDDNYNLMTSDAKKTYDRLKNINIGSESGLSYLEKKSIENGIDPMLAFYVLHRESRGDPDIISYTGCAGLFQFCYNTAHVDYKSIFGSSGEYCKNRDPSTCSNDLRLDPQKSIEAGTLYLSKLKTNYNSNIVLILTAYNAGSGIANKCKGVNEDEVVGCVLEETDNYYSKLKNPNPNKDEELNGYIAEISSYYASTLS